MGPEVTEMQAQAQSTTQYSLALSAEELLAIFEGLKLLIKYNATAENGSLKTQFLINDLIRNLLPEVEIATREMSLRRRMEQAALQAQSGSPQTPVQPSEPSNGNDSPQHISH